MNANEEDPAKMPTFAQIMSEAEAIAVAWQEFEVADAIVAEEPRRYGIVRKLSRERQEMYDSFIRTAYLRLMVKEHACVATAGRGAKPS